MVGTQRSRLGAAVLAIVACVGLVAVAPAGAVDTTVNAVTLPSGIYTLFGASCPTTSACVAVGINMDASGAIITSANGGLNWTAAASTGATMAQQYGVSCPSASHCVSVGQDSSHEPAAYVTNDGGINWTATIAPGGASSGDALRGVSCASVTKCVAVGLLGFGSIVWTSADGGATWNDHSSATTSHDLESVSCGSITHCVAVGNGNSSFTNDGGATWTTQGSDNLYGASCASAQGCLVGGYQLSNGFASVMDTSNGGSTFTNHTISPGAGGSFRGVSCPTTSVCVASGFFSGGYLATTVDGGATWSTPAVPSHISVLWGVSCAAPSVCVAVGESDTSSAAAVEFGIANTVSVTNPGDQAGSTGSAISPLAISAGDSDGTATLSYAATGLPAGVSIDATTGVIAGTPTTACACTVTVTVSDGAGGTGSTAFAWTTTTEAATTPSSYRLVARDGGVFSFGSDGFHGSTAALNLGDGIAGIATTASHDGYWLAEADGHVFAFGDAEYHGYAPGNNPSDLVVGIAPTADDGGYWMATSQGGVLNFGDATFRGSASSIPLNRSIVGIAATPGGKGYWLVASDGGVFSYGDAAFYGSTSAINLRAPIVAMAATPDGKGYSLVGADGGVFSFGDAAFSGSTGAMPLRASIVGIAATANGKGYWLVGADGGVFAFGDAPFDGSVAGMTLARPMVGMGA